LTTPTRSGWTHIVYYMSVDRNALTPLLRSAVVQWTRCTTCRCSCAATDTISTGTAMCPALRLRQQSFLYFTTARPSVAEWLACWTRAQKGPGSNLNSLRQTVHIHRASVHQAAKLVAVLLRVARVTVGLAESSGSLYRRVNDSRHLQADCQEPGSAPEPYGLAV